MKHLLAFLLLALSVYFFRDSPPGIGAFIVSTGVVILFWLLHSVSFAAANLRTILLLLGGFGLAFLLFQGRLPLTATEATTGLSQTLEINPGAISQLKTSHRIALELTLDHRPEPMERYFKISELQNTEDGLHYVAHKTKLDERRLPQASAWAKAQLSNRELSARAETVKKWWLRDFSYTLTPGELKSVTPLDEFLFNSRRGFCEHYAGALTTLLTLSGAQARVAVGFAGGAWNPVFHTLTYEMADAHAWVEVRDPTSRRWATLDPTLWVSPGENAARSDLWPMLANALTAVGLALLFLVGWAWLRALGRPPREKLLGKLKTLEKRLQIKDSGQTIQSRVERLVAAQPKQATRNGALQATLTAYLEAYYASNERMPEARRRLSRSMKKW